MSYPGVLCDELEHVLHEEDAGGVARGAHRRVVAEVGAVHGARRLVVGNVVANVANRASPRENEIRHEGIVC